MGSAVGKPAAGLNPFFLGSECPSRAYLLMQALWQYSGFEKELLKQRHCCGIAIPADDFDLILDIELKKVHLF